MTTSTIANHSIERPVLILNADYRPLSLYPLSICSWQDAIKAWCGDKVDILENYDDRIHSPSMSMPIPCVIVLKQFIPQNFTPPFTRRNLLLRDMYVCQYCGIDMPIKPKHRSQMATMDHVIPKSRGGGKNWTNIVTCCPACNIQKADKTPKEANMPLRKYPTIPNMHQLWKNSLKLLIFRHIPDKWYTYLLPDEVQQIEKIKSTP